MSVSTTFKTSDKKPEKIQNQNSGVKKILETISETRNYEAHFCTEILQGSDFPSTSRLLSNGFVSTVIQCYNSHHNLVLRPDDLWTALMVQFSFYINKEAEKFRGKFVAHEGKKELVVKVPSDSLRSVSYGLFVKLMSKEIDLNLVDPEVKGWVLPSFSTTTDDDLVICGVVFMATMKKYFDYKFSMCCGIPEVTLEGSVADWESLRGRLEKLREYELGWWVDMLQPILDQFVKAKKGKPEMDFWMRVCSNYGGGSGPSYISGWITAFCVFDKDGNKQGNYGELRDWNGVHTSPWLFLDTNDIPSGYVEVDVKIDDNGIPYNSVLFAGHLAQEIMDDNKTLKPRTGWALCLKPSPEEVKKLEEEGKKGNK